MKKIILILSIFSFIFSTNLFCQNKFGHIHSEKLLMLMPETVEAEKKIQEFNKMLEEQLQTMFNEYQNKAGEFQANESLMTNVVRETKLKEIQDLEVRIQEFQQTSQQSSQDKRTEILAPILEKAQNAIDQVALENNYTYIFDIAIGSIVYGKDSNDITELVKSKMGIQ
ncbi:MAG: hypothetical protein CMD07_04525 [Flavobacteriales bacterium]|nr:hypothetical protein [Flavobacteriales bacterium]|tara:strand:+ start:2296 stop:2802 length:507 start_codon:yes stop_codon:yes gene_type:complete